MYFQTIVDSIRTEPETKQNFMSRSRFASSYEERTIVCFIGTTYRTNARSLLTVSFFFLINLSLTLERCGTKLTQSSIDCSPFAASFWQRCSFKLVVLPSICRNVSKQCLYDANPGMISKSFSCVIRARNSNIIQYAAFTYFSGLFTTSYSLFWFLESCWIDLDVYDIDKLDSMRFEEEIGRMLSFEVIWAETEWRSSY